jgi:hypothetical protein
MRMVCPHCNEVHASRPPSDCAHDNVCAAFCSALKDATRGIFRQSKWQQGKPPSAWG